MILSKGYSAAAMISSSDCAWSMCRTMGTVAVVQAAAARWIRRGE